MTTTRRRSTPTLPPLALALLAVLWSPALGAAEPTVADRELLAAADLFASAPESFRARVRVEPLGGGGSRELEIWRAPAADGPDDSERALVRFLDPDEAGKFLLRREGRLYFLAPGTRRAVPLSPSHRLQGLVSLDEILGLDLAGSFRITSVARHPGQVVFDLEARPGTRAAYPRVRYVVATETGLPIRADLKAANGTTVRVLESPEWLDRAGLVPRVLVAKDPTRGLGARIEFLELEAAEVPAGLFDLEDGTARSDLD